MHYDVIIVGAGVIGGMLARNLSRYQLHVCLLEKENDVAMAPICWWGGSVKYDST